MHICTVRLALVTNTEGVSCERLIKMGVVCCTKDGGRVLYDKDGGRVLYLLKMGVVCCTSKDGGRVLYLWPTFIRCLLVNLL
jgi:hypothetical protein